MKCHILASHGICRKERLRPVTSQRRGDGGGCAMSASGLSLPARDYPHKKNMLIRLICYRLMPEERNVVACDGGIRNVETRRKAVRLLEYLQVRLAVYDIKAFSHVYLQISVIFYRILRN